LPGESLIQGAQVRRVVVHEEHANGIGNGVRCHWTSSAPACALRALAGFGQALKQPLSTDRP